MSKYDDKTFPKGMPMVGNAPPLTDEEMIGAKKDLIYPYRNIIRDPQDPLPVGQAVGVYSIAPLKECRDGVHGMIKIRGCYPDDKTAELACEKIIKEVDSAHLILRVPVGSWQPLTLNPEFIRDFTDVASTEEEKLAVESMKANKEEHLKIAKQIKDNKKALEEEKDPTEDTEGLKFYAIKRIAVMEMKKYVEEYEAKKMGMQKNVDKAIVLIRELDRKHPEYASQWRDEVNKARAERGIAGLKRHEGEL